MAIMICSLLEYITSYAMEKLFKARWWDYSNKKFNINGRICLETMVPFGILGLGIMYVTNPILLNMFSRIPIVVLHILAITFLIAFVTDSTISLKIISNVRTTQKTIPADNTEEITNKVREILKNKSKLNRRLMNAYPNLEAKVKKIKTRLKESK